MHKVNVFASCAMQSIVYACACVRIHTDVACTTLDFAVTLVLCCGWGRTVYRTSGLDCDCTSLVLSGK